MRAPSFTGRTQGQRGGNRARTISLVLVVLVAVAPSLDAQALSWWVGESVSRAERYTYECSPECGFVRLQSPGSVRSLAVGVDLTAHSTQWVRVMIGGAVARRGWRAGEVFDPVVLTVPIMLAITPFGADAPLGLAFALGLQGDLSLERLNDSRVGIPRSTWLYADVSRGRRLTLGIRSSRTTRDQNGLWFVQSRVLFVGLSNR